VYKKQPLDGTSVKPLIAFLLFISFDAFSIDNNVMNAHYINVGQADSALLEFSCGAVLIDAGSQDDANTNKLLGYLDKFFKSRPDLNETIDSIIITHNHIDHTRGLKEVVSKYKVRNFVGTGQNHGSGSGEPNWVRKQSERLSINVRTPKNTEVRDGNNTSGLTGNMIDPIDCSGKSADIKIISAPLTDNPGWSHEEFDNKNNHSLVIRVDFGESSFLFTGDLEGDGIEHMLSYYGNDDNSILNTDVYQVGHHGSYNGTTTNLLNAMSPEIAVLSIGKWDFGKMDNKIFSTYSYGHPRITLLDDLSLSIKKRRSTPINVMAARAAKNFEEYPVKRKIYATAWDGNIKISAKYDGSMRVTTQEAH
jgi:beta-lactamase superfamily II metal-dependent hydrolase